MKRFLRIASVVVALGVAASAARAGERDRNERNPCESLAPAAAGGPVPRDDDRLVVRWLGTTNYELSFRNQVILLDTYYDRGPRNRPIGLMPGQVTRADAIFLGHGHFDHMSDASFIASKLGIRAIGGPPTFDKLLAQGLPQGQAVRVTGTGGELFRFRGFTVEPVLAHHSVLSGAVIGAFTTAIQTELGTPTAEEAAAEAVVRARGSSSPLIITIGTIAYLFTFDSGFRLIWLDSAGPITDQEIALMKRIGHTDVAIVAYVGHYVQETQIPVTMALVQLFNPRFYLPAHHDEIRDIFPDLGLEPLFLTMRDETDIKPISLLYRGAVCFNVKSGKLAHDEN
jgi:L-ascorbate metabolism protein UlaG (beta-lactamase superfamily)